MVGTRGSETVPFPDVAFPIGAEKDAPGMFSLVSPGTVLSRKKDSLTENTKAASDRLKSHHA